MAASADSPRHADPKGIPLGAKPVVILCRSIFPKAERPTERLERKRENLPTFS